MWEWAPPCNHYHMPYWGEMGTLLACTQRLSYLLAQGVHQCDAAIVYPVAAVEADAIQGKHSVETAFAVGRKLYQEGIDFDFIDFESLDRAEMKEGNAWVSGERYQYLILPDMANVRFSMMESLLGFVENGGKLIILGKLPQGSDRTGRNDKKLRELCDILKEKGKSVTTAEQVVEYIQGEGRLDFSAECSKEVFYQHRNENGRDYYYIYGVEKGCKCRFRADGIPVLLNPWSGKRMRLTDFESKEGITEISFPLTSYDPTIIAFEENSSEALELPDFKMKSEKILDINGEWECQIIPTMDNQYGDYRLPASDDFIGPEAREAFYCISEEDMRNQVSDAAWKSEWLTYGVYYWVCHNNINKENVFIKMEKPSDEFSPRVCSMKYGVKGDAGYQGSYHGLKGKLSDEFITLGEKKVLQAGSDSIYEGEGNYYVFMIFHSQNEMYANIQTGTLKPDAIWLNHKPVTGDVVTLKQGENYVLLRYGKSGRTYFMLEKDHKFTQELPLVTKWYQNTDILLSDPMPDLERKTCWLRFTSPPGMRGIRLLSHGDTRVFVGEKELEYKDGVYWSDKVFANSETVYVKICQEKGFYGCNAILEPVRFVLERGRVKLPLDWEREGLKFYSGGIRLIRKYYVQNTECVKLCVPGIASAVHVKVNGVDACSLVAEPYEGDLSRYLSKGENTIELFCYNTMHNHMLTVPTNFNFDKSPDWRQES